MQIRISGYEKLKVSNCHIQYAIEKTHPPRNVTSPFHVAIWVRILPLNMMTKVKLSI